MPEIPNIEALLASAPPLSTDLSSVDTSLPLIADGKIVDFNIEKIEQAATKDGKGVYLSIDHKSITQTDSVKGDPLLPGSVHVFNNINLIPTGKATWDMIERNIAAIAQAAGLTMGTTEFIKGGWMQLNGKTVRAKVSYVPEGPDKSGVTRRAKNEIAVYLKQ